MKLSIIPFILNKIKSGLGIVQDTDTATQAIAKDKYVFWKGKMKKASSAISANDTLSSTNLSDVTDGALNAISDQVGTLTNLATTAKTDLVSATNEIVNGYTGYGTNSNGSYWKFKDGTMICAKIVKTGSIECSGTWGALYESTTKVSLGNWAQTFTATPFVSVTPVSGNMAGWFEKLESTSKTFAGEGWVCRATSQTNWLQFHVIGIGKWK